tara:strand:- start:288 stop:1115 length:828 start_codon:yes stop_codon:yes gene_type:complete
MRGRLHASAVAALGNTLPLITPATIGLVALRKGFSEGGLICLWGLLPVFLTYFFSDSNQFFVLLTACNFLNVLLVCGILRYRGDWEMTLVSLVIISIILMGSLLLIFQQDFEVLVQRLIEVFEEASRQTNIESLKIKKSSIAVFTTWTIILNTFLGVVIARWWQAIIFNPGGFKEEFQGIRLNRRLLVLIFSILVLSSAIFNQYSNWAYLSIFPLVVGGLSLFHWLVNEKNLGKVPIIFTYVFMVLFTPFVILILALLGTVDCFYNVRQRLRAKV